ncbi:MAG: flagellar export chaperone FlgN [Limnochordia bacterium]
MREIRERINALTTAYTEQLALYKEIGEVGSQEGELISTGQLDRLLQVLKTKEGLLRRAGEYEREISQRQEELVKHFGLASFSLPQLRLAAPEYYQDDLAALEAVLSELAPVLEHLENQERQNEAQLSAYLKQTQAQQAVQRKRAGRAYGKKKM